MITDAQTRQLHLNSQDSCILGKHKFVYGRCTCGHFRNFKAELKWKKIARLYYKESLSRP